MVSAGELAGEAMSECECRVTLREGHGHEKKKMGRLGHTGSSIQGAMVELSESGIIVVVTKSGQYAAPFSSTASTSLKVTSAIDTAECVGGGPLGGAGREGGGCW